MGARSRGVAEAELVSQAVGAVAQMLRHTSDVLVESPATDAARAAGWLAATAAVERLASNAATDARLARVEEQSPFVAVVDPAEVARAAAAAAAHPRHDARPAGLLPVVSRPAVGCRGVSSAVLRIDPGRADVAAAFGEDVILVVLFGSAEVRWVDDAGAAQRLTVARFQQVFVRRGTPHLVVAHAAAPLLALRIRACGDAAAPGLPVPRAVAALLAGTVVGAVAGTVAGCADAPAGCVGGSVERTSETSADETWASTAAGRPTVRPGEGVWIGR